METGRFCFGARKDQICLSFCYCAVDQEKAVFQWKRAVSGPSAFLVPEMVKFALNFCYCAVDQEKGRFSMETGRFWPICLFGAGNGQICLEYNFCYCAVNQEKAVVQWKRAVSGPSAFLVPEMVKFALNFCYCAVDQEKGRFSMETGRFWPICLFGAGNGQICLEYNFCYCAVNQEKAVVQWKRAVSGPSAL